MSLEDITAFAFDLAYAWRISPGEVFEMPPSEMVLYAEHMNRIQEKIHDGG